MFRSLERVPSRFLERQVHLWRFGHYGRPLLVFPSAAGTAHEWEHYGLIESLSGRLAAGELKLYCTESNVSEAWLAGDHPAARIARHQAFERYVVHELMPRIRLDCRTPDLRVAVAGVSLGAYYAATLLLKHPDLFDYALCLSGRYDARWMTDGFDSPAVYLSNPTAFVPDLGGRHLELLRRAVHLDLVCGQGDWEGANVEATRQFAALLAARAIPHGCHLWGPEASHEPQWWNRQAQLYLAQWLGQAS